MTTEIPKRVRVLIIGGGIHGVGVLHDLASRGWQDIFLVEKGRLGEGTSSRSTKLIHGGLRYLQNIRDFGLVSEGLHERRVLLDVAPDICKPVEFMFPLLKGGGVNSITVQIGLTLYDLLAGRAKLQSHKKVSMRTLAEKAPTIDIEKFKACYSFWDGQTDDLELVKRVAGSAQKLGVNYAEQCYVEKIVASDDGWNVFVKSGDETHMISALYVVNTAGPWAHELLKRSQIEPTHEGLNNQGAHIIFDDIGLKSGVFLQAPEDKRIFFVLPWQGYTLVGTTESRYDGAVDKLTVDERDIDYILNYTNRYFKNNFTKNDIRASFTGLRWLAVEKGKNISRTSRSYDIGRHNSKRGMMMTLYGGKLTAYRAVSEDIGDEICKHFGEFTASQTHLKSFWIQRGVPLAPDILKRFVGA